MATNSKTPSIDIFDDIIKNLHEQITATINALSPDKTQSKYCYQTSNDLVKELLNIIYIPIKYEFFIKYIGNAIIPPYIVSNTPIFKPVIPENTYVSPSDISVVSKLSLDIHSNSNTIDTIDTNTKIIININTSESSKDSANAYMYMFQLAFGQLNNLDLVKEYMNKLTITEELYKAKNEQVIIKTKPTKIHVMLPLSYSGFNTAINDTSQSIWKSAFLYKKFALNVSFTTITSSSNGQNRSISILEPTIRTVEYEPVKNRTVDNTSTQKPKVYAETTLPAVPKQNENAQTSRTPHQGSKLKLPPINTTNVATPRKK